MQKKTGGLVFVLLILVQFSFSQTADSTKNIFHLKGAITVTTKGISFIPSFSLGKPAAIFEFSVGKKKLFFEPQFRFSLGGKPWSFVFWWRYKLVENKKFNFTLGAHPALNFKTETYEINGIANKVLVTRRYLAGELAPNYFVSKNITVGLYLLMSRGIDKGTVRNTQFLTVNSNFSHIRLGQQFYARFIPQVYYLKQDKNDGFYVTSMLTLAKNNSPFSVQSVLNKVIRTDIPGSRNFLWNASLIYSFNKAYLKR